MATNELSRATSMPAKADHRWLVLVVVSIAQLMVVLDATIVNVALPSAQAALGFDNSQRQWIVTAYALAFGLAAAGSAGAFLFAWRKLKVGAPTPKASRYHGPFL